MPAIGTPSFSRMTYSLVKANALDQVPELATRLGDRNAGDHRFRICLTRHPFSPSDLFGVINPYCSYYAGLAEACQAAGSGDVLEK